MLKCLVLSDCAVPSSQRPRAEGGGLRAWGLARGLQANAIDFCVSLAEPAVAAGESGGRWQSGIEMLTWTPESLPSLIQPFDAVVVSYCAGGLSPLVVSALTDAQQLILDCNVPFHVEVSARESRSLDREFAYFMADLRVVTAVLRRGDVFLCASERQKLYYQGVLSGVGRLNPATYRSELLEIVPYGIDDDEPEARSQPIGALTRRPASTKLLWFGAMYPWFDIAPLLEAVALLNDQGMDVTLTIVGARNPTSTHPDFLVAFDAFDELMASPRYRAHVFSQGWVDFADRADWFLDADLGVMISKLGLENSLAWRTRLVDMVWGRLPVATNAGDLLGDLLVERGAAARLPPGDAGRLAAGLRSAIEVGASSMRANLETVRRELGWMKVTQGVAAHVRSKTRAPDLSPHFVEAAARVEHQLSRRRRGYSGYLHRAGALVRRLRQHGLIDTFRHLRGRLARSG